MTFVHDALAQLKIQRVKTESDGEGAPGPLPNTLSVPEALVR